MNKNYPSYLEKNAHEGWDLLVRVQPGAKKSEFSGVLDGRLKVRLSAPAVENKANKALIAFIAKALGIRASQIQLVSGDTSRLKRLQIKSPHEPDWHVLQLDSSNC